VNCSGIGQHLQKVTDSAHNELVSIYLLVYSGVFHVPFHLNGF